MNRNLDRTGKLTAQTPEEKREMERKLVEIREMYRDEGNDCDPNCSCQCPGSTEDNMSDEDEHVTYMPAEQFDELVRTLDEPDL